MQRFWFFDLEGSIAELMADPEFVAAWRQARVQFPGSYWGSPEHHRMKQATSGAVDSPHNGVIELWFDFAQPYNFANHSTGLMFFRWAWEGS
jgi:hypothetical protein